MSLRWFEIGSMPRKIPELDVPRTCDYATRELRRLKLMGKVADRLGIRRQAPYTWHRVPAEHVLIIAEISGLTPHKIRSDLYPHDLRNWRPGAPKHAA